MDEDESRGSERMLLARIERKLNFFGEILCGGIGLGAGYAAYKIISSDLGFGD